MAVRLERRKIPPQLQNRKREILGDIKDDTMLDCVYNSMIAGEIENTPPLADIEKYVPNFLLKHQLVDLSKSLGRSAVFNINKPGYGKTLETILWIKINLKKNFKALVLCPKSVISTWEEQLDKYWPDWYKESTWWITNYEQLFNEEKFTRAKAFEWDIIVLDESHTIKSFSSKTHHLCSQLKSSAKHCLTGTPVKNRPEDIAAQLKWLDPYSITNHTDFKLAFCDIQKTRWGGKSEGLTRDKVMLANLQQLLSLYCVGGEEHDITGKPEYIKVRLKLDPKVKKLYRDAVGEYDEVTKKRVIDTAALLTQGIKISNPIEAATRRQQIASNCQLFNESLHNVKFEWVADWLKGTDEKVVIYTKYAKTADMLEKVLIARNFSVSRVKREQSSQARTRAVSAWKNSEQVLLGTMGVLGTGIDGLQGYTKYAIFVEREWTATENDQAERRLRRIGGDKSVTFYILQAIGTIDVQIERVQHIKGADARLLLEPVSELD